MVITTTITSFTTPVPAENIISELSKALKALPSHPQFTLGTKAQDRTTVQITAEWPSIQAPNDLSTSPAYQAFTDTISTISPTPLQTTIATLNASVFAADNPPLVEFVHSYFPASSPPDFCAKIEGDFARFEAIYRRRGSPDACGEIGLATGWAEEKDGARAFVVVRGWREMGRFEAALATEEFGEGIGILMGWEVPFELWHVERKAGSDDS